LVSAEHVDLRDERDGLDVRTARHQYVAVFSRGRRDSFRDRLERHLTGAIAASTGIARYEHRVRDVAVEPIAVRIEEHRVRHVDAARTRVLPDRRVVEGRVATAVRTAVARVRVPRASVDSGIDAVGNALTIDGCRPLGANQRHRVGTSREHQTKGRQAASYEQ